MANKQLSEFEKGQIMEYNDCWQSLLMDTLLILSGYKLS